MNSTDQPQISKSIIKTITIMYYTYCEVIIVFGIAAIYIKENTAITFAYYQVAFFYLVPIFAIIIGLLSYFVFKKNLKKVHKINIKEKTSKV